MAPGGHEKGVNARPVGRLAPSPSGLLHLGHARTFLLAWWSIRSRGGRVLLRIEDLDADRAQPQFVDAILRDLEWLGLDWDGPALVQSSNLEAMRAAIDDLIARGLAYPCVCSRAEIRAMQSAPQQGQPEARYPGTCRDRFDSLDQAERRSGRTAGLRFRVADGAITIADEIQGPVTVDVQQEVGDFLIARRDRAPAYQLAVVVDDAGQGVTEVLRGCDLLPSAARQAHLLRALGLAQPVWRHAPLVVDALGRRLAKRAADLALAELREAGVDPRQIVHWAARVSGIAAPAGESAAAIAKAFDLRQIPLTPVRLPADPRSALAAPEAAARPRPVPDRGGRD